MADRTNVYAWVGSWVPGEPADAKYPVRTKGSIPVRAYRCTVCASVRLYAPEAEGQQRTG